MRAGFDCDQGRPGLVNRLFVLSSRVAGFDDPRLGFHHTTISTASISA